MKNSNDNKPTHTPGPWQVSASDVLDTVEIVQTPRGALGPCALATMHRTVANFTTVDRREANAALIAAAPEMLEALEYIAFHAPKCKTPQELDRCMDTIKAAIRKAKGQV